MRFEEINYKIMCDVPGCGKVSKYSLQHEKFTEEAGLYFCDECAKNLYHTIGTHLIPKSPKNMLNNPTKR